ncbi:MAG: ATP-dependent helicase HrpB [Hyphomonadaceae bacterium]|nr:ATP-dependent helicase HrpB [Hyphomonadaceae bacterium]
MEAPEAPIDAVLPELQAVLSQRAEAVLVAPPGAGKTTRAPLALLDADWAAGGKIVLLSPRRMAARAAAGFMARLRGENVGETIGYRVRLDSRIGPRTRVEVVTEGVFTRMILADPALEGVAAVLFDEFHERSLEGDLGLALARDAQGLRPDLRLLVMSATLDVARVAAALGGAPVIEAKGRMFPVEIEHAPRKQGARLEDEVAAAVTAALAAHAGSLLVFLPGAREIERVAELLRGRVNADVRPLYGAMAGPEQDAAIAPAPDGRRKVVLATSIAETSLTIEGVRVVIDAGLARRPRYEPDVGLTRLETVRVSQAAAEQRRGRAGRLEPGVCIRLWEAGETRALAPHDRPEMLDADLSGLALDLAAWGAPDPYALTWLDPPPAPAWAEAQKLLRATGALDADGRLTPHGSAMARLPLPARLAHMVLAADEPALAAEIALVLTEQGLGGRDVDLSERVRRWRSERSPRAQAARQLAQRIAKMAGAKLEEGDVSRAGAVLLRAYPDRVAKARGAGAFTMANGRAASLDAAEALAREPFLAIAEIAGAAANARILLAAPITREAIEAELADEIETKIEATFDGDAVRATRAKKLGRITLSEGPAQVTPEAVEAALRDAVQKRGLPWSEDDRQLRARVAMLRALGRDYPDWSDAALDADLGWLPLAGASKLSALDLGAALEARLTYAQKRALENDAPVRFETPAGGSAKIDYTAEAGPAIDVRLQEMFGTTTHPAVAGGKVPLLVRLTSPAHRPVATTKDLPGFWKGAYADVRRDMRGRYPKHPWPEDPLLAPPTRRAKPRP